MVGNVIVESCCMCQWHPNFFKPNETNRMKLLKITLTMLTLISLSIDLLAQQIYEKKFSSNVLEEEVEYSVFLPVDYSAKETYPLLITLHGYNGDNNTYRWLIEKLSKSMDEGKFPKTIIISPNGKKSWYIDDYQKIHSYSTMFIEEFIPYINSNYSVSINRNRRAITGMSMGGFGALRFAMLYPKQFGICISEQAAMSTKDQAVSDAYFEKFHGGLYGKNLQGKDRVNQHFLSNNPLYIAESLSHEALKQTKWFIQSPDDDFHSLPNAELHALFHRAEVKHEYRVNDGKHGLKRGLGDIDERIEYLARWLVE